MLTVDWAEELIDEAVQLDGSVVEIELPCMVPKRRGAPTPDQKEIRADVMKAVKKGTLIPRNVELHHGDHIAWSGSRFEVDEAKAKSVCVVCGVAVAREQLLLIERFAVPQHTVDRVLAFRIAASR